MFRVVIVQVVETWDCLWCALLEFLCAVRGGIICHSPVEDSSPGEVTSEPW